MAVTLLQTKDQMLFVHHARRCDWLDFTRKEKRLRISISKRLQQFVPAQKFDIDVSERELMIQLQAGLQSFFGKKFARGAAKCFGKMIEIFLAYYQPGRHLMSAVFLEAISATIQRFDQVQSLDASPASLADSLLVKANYYRRPMIFSNQPGRYDAEHSRMPTLRADHDGGVGGRVELIFDLLDCRVEDLLFHCLAVSILLVKLRRKQHCFASILRKKQPKSFLRCAKPPRGIQSRSEPVANVLRQDRLPNSGHLH